MAGPKDMAVIESGRTLRDHHEVDEAEVMKKLNRNLLPLFFLTTVLCYVDRTNLAFAALQLNKSLGFTEKVYGLGSGIFFIGYSLFQVCLSMQCSIPLVQTYRCCLANLPMQFFPAVQVNCPGGVPAHKQLLFTVMAGSQQYDTCQGWSADLVVSNSDLMGVCGHLVCGPEDRK